MQCATLIDLLQLRAEQQAEKRAYTFMIDGKVEGKTFTYAELDLQARAIAAQLQQYYAHGERALLLYPQGLEFLAAFFGCLYAGVIAIPVPPPEASRLKRTLPRLQAIAKDAQAKFTLTTESILALVNQHRQQIPEFKAMHWLTTENIQTDLALDWQRPIVQADDLAYLQYTSGSTSTPKGVMISHSNLLHHGYYLKQACSYTSESKTVTWMPYFHDYGLVEGMFVPIFNSTPCYLMSPFSFLKQPFQWLKNISSYNATHTQAPNFAYELCLKRISEQQKSELDLSSWQAAGNAAEPINPKVLKAFYESFKQCGFRWEAFCPAYGLAENTLLATFSAIQKQPMLQAFNNKLETKEVLSVDAMDNQATIITGCGQPIGKTYILIVDPETFMICQSNQVGEIWISDPSVAQGYWQNEQATKETFQAYTSDTNEGPFLRTGDLGFLYENELFITGRLKDLIIINGVNYYPQDIEWSIEQSHDLIRNSQSAAFSIVIDNEEQLVILAELEKKSGDTQAIIQAIRKAVFEYYELQPHAIVLLKKGSVLKTSSGKIQRNACKKAFLNNELGEIVRDLLSDSTSNMFVAPQSANEIQIAQIWADVLHIPFEQISIQDSFFKYGGQSLLAVEIINQINQYFNISLTAYSLFEYTTIEKLAAHINPLAKQQYIAITHTEQKHYPVSYMQQQIWLACNQAPDIAIYNEPLFIHFDTQIDTQILEKSIQFIVQRHTILHSVFKVKQGTPIQKLKEHKQCSLQIVDLQHLPANDKETEYQNLAHILISKPFDLEKDILLRAILFQFDTEKNTLVFVAHHLVVDGLSIYQTFLQELHTCYQSFIDNKQPNLPKLSIQYSDYAHWQRQIPIPTAQMDYWQQKLTNIEALQLPTDFPYPAKNTYQGATHSFNLSKDIVAKLKKVAQEQDTTVFMNLLAVFYILLYRYTGQNDIVVSTVINQRNRPELEHLIGLFLNTLMLRTVFKDEFSFLELLQETRKVALEAYTHQDAPFTEILQNLRTTQNINAKNLFQVAFVLEPAVTDIDKHWSCSLLDVHTNAAKFDLTLQFEDKKDVLVGRFEYRTDLFKAKTIERMAGHFQTLLDAALNQPNLAIAELSLLTEAEQKQFQIWNNTQADFPQDKCIHQLFEAQVERVPNNIALVFGQQQLTYSELNQRANQLAHHLISLGVQPETLVGICINRSLEMVIGLLAILKAGGAYVPLDYNYPEERINFMINDAKIKVLLAQKNALSKLSVPENITVLTVEEWDWLDKLSSENPKTNVTPHNLAYVIYTSGSTGQPKGVLLEHKGACNLSSAQIKLFKLSSEDTILQFSSLSFDAATWDVIMALMSGAHLYIPAHNEILVGKSLANALLIGKVSVVTLPPSVLNTLLFEHMESSKYLRAFIVVGEKSSIDLINSWSKREFCIINAYGPTESTICTTSTHCLTNLDDTIPIGKALPNIQAHILDKNQQQIPIGLTGELYIGGIGVARGYLNRPKLTAQKFITNPLTKNGNDRLYKTGDLVRFLEDGQLEFVGRIDHQVKIRGFRVELEEIESILKQHNDIQDAAIMIKQSTENNKYIAAYFVPKFSTRRISFKTICQLKFDNGMSMALSSENISCHGMGLIGVPISCNCQEQQGLTLQFSLPNIDKLFDLVGHVAWIKGHRMGVSFNCSDDALCEYIEQALQLKEHRDDLHRNSATLLRRYLADRLPHYMIPSAFILLDKMPLTPNGKIDRHALTQQTNQIRLDLQLSYTAPETDLEQIIADIWKQVLQLDKVGIHDSFFDLGGDSLQLVKVQELLETKLQSEFPTAILFQYPSLNVLAHYFAEQMLSNDVLLKDSQPHQQRVLQRKKAHQQRKKRHIRKDN
ncbi:amino acid adenylation domain-containing protein [Candidatus Albibeggiatoa sp. nov. BB20]|uniref:amino acid adenylation domain-containing protein n=1 Tax=Candidatus Albibeggiatoa sp. nov. BB20 TaxID=3162723 RepID=UPI0033655A39